MALTATIYTFTIDLSDMDRSVFETLSLRVARHPSETVESMVVRVLAYCLEYQEGIELTEGVSSGDEPALLVRDLTGRDSLDRSRDAGCEPAAPWHEAGGPRRRLHAPRHASVPGSAGRRRIHRADEIPIRAFDRAR